jgi:hypothetical protein
MSSGWTLDWRKIANALTKVKSVPASRQASSFEIEEAFRTVPSRIVREDAGRESDLRDGMLAEIRDNWCERD